MTGFLLPALGAAAVALLVRSGVAHSLDPDRFRRSLEAQDLVPALRRDLLAGVLGGVELLLASTGGAALAGAAPTAAGLAVAALGAAFVAYLGVLSRARPGAPCGCAGTVEDGPPGVLALARAGAVLAGGVAIAFGAADRLAALAPGERATTLVAGVAVAAVIDVAAASDPRLIVAAEP